MGSFPIDTEAQAVFSLLTLKAVPWLAGLSVIAAFSQQRIARLSILRRAAAYVATVLLCWLTGASIAALILR